MAESTSTLVSVVQIAIPSALALVGTAIGVYFAYRKWHLERRDSEAAAYRKERQSAYMELWKRLQEAHAIFETKSLDQPTIASRMDSVEQDVKTYFLNHGVYVDDDDREVVLSYIQYLRMMRLGGRAPGDVPGLDPKRLRDEIPHADAVIQRAVELNRKQLIAKIRQELGA
jgi:hypothetical protein